jgi:hypothetical protein
MVEGKRNVSHASTKYWVDVILATSWQCHRFGSEREALSYAPVYARLPNAEAVVAYAYRPEAEAKLGRRAKPARRTSQSA